MLLNNCKKIIISIVFVACTVTLFAETKDLSVRFLDKANEAFEENNIEDAYKYVNQALAVAKDKESQANVLYFAQTVYSVKLQNLLEKYDDMAFIDIQMNLEKYPNVENTKIKKLMKQIETEQANIAKAAEKAEVQAQRKIEAERFEAQQESLEAQTQAMKEQADAIKQQAEDTKQSQEALKEAIIKQAEVTQTTQAEFKNALETGLKDMGNAFTESAKEQKRSTKVIAFAVIGIAIIILIVVLLIIVIVRHGIKQQKIQQENYVQAFKMLAATQNQTNRIMLGGAVDIYGQGNMRIAGTSTWAPAQALPDVTFTEEDEEELKQLAIKCEEIGQKIDSATGRKNNSKNVSEIVYKLSIQLGLPQGLAMLNFCAAMIYDAGFLGIDPDLLSSTTLTEEEKEAMKEHVNLAEKYLSFVPKKYWSVFEDAAMKHHENIDGTGYPKGLKGDEIPQIARLIRVAESYVSLSSRRSYRGAMDKESAVAALREQENLYDKDVVDVLEQIV
ncbi:MAG: HD domain-containing phosphohydrolase [Treponema sp.]|nr:HD domain-containing phosphohydrolase [Treponema sp.]